MIGPSKNYLNALAEDNSSYALQYRDDEAGQCDFGELTLRIHLVLSALFICKFVDGFSLRYYLTLCNYTVSAHNYTFNKFGDSCVYF